MIEKFGTTTGGKPYFLEIKHDMRRMNQELKESGDEVSAKKSEDALLHLENAIDDIMENFVFLKQLITDYDTKLLNVISRHEDDFLGAYKTHMSKVEKQLQMLKDKAKEQEDKLNNDERIVKMEKQLGWYKGEFESLLKLKDKNSNQNDRIGGNIDNLNDEKRYKEEQIKAQKRQNKLLAIALAKV